MRARKWSVSPFGLVVLVVFLAAVAATVFGSGGLAKVGIVVAILTVVFAAISSAVGPSITRLPGSGPASAGRGDAREYARGGPNYAGAPDDGSGAQYISKADTPSDEAWQRERARYEDKQARRGDT